MAPRAQTRAKEQATSAPSRGHGRRADPPSVETPDTGGSQQDVWEPIPGTRFFSRSGSGMYERLTDQLFLRVDEVGEADAVEVATRFAEAFAKSTNTKAPGADASVEKEAAEILARMDRELLVEEALTRQLLQRYGLAS